MNRVLLIGTFETKREELGYLASALRKHGLDVMLLDVSLANNGVIWSGAEKLAQMAAKAEAAAAHITEHSAECSVAIGVGGGTGGEIVLAAIKGLPSTYPKILITTLAFDPRPALADSSITIIPTLCDIEGLNTQLRQVFENAAAAVAGLTRADRVEGTGRLNIAITTLGATGRAGSEIARGLGDAGYETTVFHANGYGGAAFTRFVAEGHASGVIDMNVHELGRIRLAGAHVDMPGRFTAASHLPRVVLPGALNFIGLGAVDTISPEHLRRPYYRHTNQFTHIKLTASEMADQAQAWADKLNQSTAPCHAIVPMGGFSHEDRDGGAIHDPELRDIAADILEQNAANYTVTRLPHHINTPETAQAAVAALRAIMP
ncbi:Tm-1-like ATP-binding domain-containing protein [Octadecabacter sp. G9-8]|uniref:Tm-1-like ATP-binding domain-containing protein n=1 Tax=Octadecabacter dasysiphoniae TaxID=2909341 RepID=A0ABS9CRM4_9RHOB|nr:Tm-1-like ATP-binding domain-containing protein [Octadecabacter dasysiphoniae]MCF2869848.1 Tm-1-like ATP-binding domain-containing protein [Octadecabacter dasysiphoniae]